MSMKLKLLSEYTSGVPPVTLYLCVGFDLGCSIPQVGEGEEAVAGCECTMSYKGTLKEGGATFDQANKFKFCLGAGEVIKGWEVKQLRIRAYVRGGGRCGTR